MQTCFFSSQSSVFFPFFRSPSYELYLQMQHFNHRFLTDMPLRSDPRLLLGISFQDNLVPWQDPRAVCRTCLALHVDPVFLASDAPCPFSWGAGLCPSCTTSYGSTLDCVSCTEYREHFQVLASVVCWYANAATKDAFASVLEHLFAVSRGAAVRILEFTTARALPSGSTILFRAHARLLVGFVPGVNAVARGVNLPRYLSFARSAQTLDPDPLLGFAWSDFLRALSGRTLTSVNPRPCLVGAAPFDGVNGRRLEPLIPAPLDGYLDVHAASAVNNFVNAWDDHHQNGIREGRIQEPGAIASVVFPAAAPLVAPPVVPAAPFIQHASSPLQGNGYPQSPVHYGSPSGGAYVPNQRFVFGQDPPQQPPRLNFQPFGQHLAEQFIQPQQGFPQGFHHQYAQQPQFMMGQQYPLGQNQQYLIEQNASGQQFHNQHYPVNHVQQVPQYPFQPAPQLAALHNVPLHDFSFFPPNHSMNTSAAAQLGKSATVAGAHNTWLRKNTLSLSVKIQSFPRGADSVDGKPRSRPFDIPYATNVLSEQYVFISDEPIQISQREHILVCFVQTCIAWSHYILPLTGNDPRKLPFHVGQMSQVLANIREVASMFGTSEAVVLRVCHFISVRNIASCLNPGDTITLQDPLDVSTNFFQAALAKFIADNRARTNAPQQQQQGYRRPLALDGDPPARQAAAPQRQRHNFRNAVAVAAVVPVVQPIGAVPAARNDQVGRCNKFWWGQPCFVHRAGQPCHYRHVCKTCGVVVTAAEAVVHLQSHI
jgi:hypothetical protein